MYDIIYRNLDRQTRGLALLYDLMREEYQLLLNRDAEEIMTLELSIHELLRQLAVEKQEVRTLLGGGKLMDYAAMLEDAEADALREMYQVADSYEQACARQATMNTEISLALLDLSKETMEFLYSRLAPPVQNTYGRKGGYVESRPEASLISGRL